MSWIEKSNQNIDVITGDGSKFTLLWMRAQKSKEYNVAEFNFPGVPGTLVSRGTPRGRRYNVEMYFQGDDHLDFSAVFDDASDDPRPWQLIHPLYGTLFVQPISLSYDNTSHNVTKITGTVVETILEDRPKVRVDAPDQVINLSQKLSDLSALSVAVKLKPLNVNEVEILKQNTTTVFNVGKKSILDTVSFERYFNLFNNALTDLDNAINDPLTAIRSAQAVINAPFIFASNVKVRIDTLTSQFDTLLLTVGNLTGLNQKRIFENNMSGIVSGMALTSVTNYSYASREDVLFVIESITDKYNLLLTTLDGLQTESGEEDSYHPDVDSMMALYDLVNFTIANLFNVAVDSKQQRSVVLLEDSNAVLLTHRFYGMDDTDSNLERFVTENKIGLSEMLQIKKGRRVTYYL
jgi:prophage DNA circulation protein